MTELNDRFAAMLPAIPQGLADENARLVAENKALKAALKPFGRMFHLLNGDGYMTLVAAHQFQVHTSDGEYTGVDIQDADFKRAAEALNGGAS